MKKSAFIPPMSPLKSDEERKSDDETLEFDKEKYFHDLRSIKKKKEKD